MNFRQITLLLILPFLLTSCSKEWYTERVSTNLVEWYPDSSVIYGNIATTPEQLLHIHFTAEKNPERDRIMLDLLFDAKETKVAMTSHYMDPKFRRDTISNLRIAKLAAGKYNVFVYAGDKDTNTEYIKLPYELNVPDNKSAYYFGDIDVIFISKYDKYSLKGFFKRIMNNDKRFNVKVSITDNYDLVKSNFIKNYGNKINVPFKKSILKRISNEGIGKIKKVKSPLLYYRKY